jgi:hypothetical protein
VVAVKAGDTHTVALKGDGTVVAWGAGTIFSGSYPHYGQSIIPANLSGVIAIAAGDTHTVALKNDGTVVAWGAGTTSTGNEPNFGQSIVPLGLSGVTAIAAGGYNTAVIVGAVPTSIFAQPTGQSFGLGGSVTLSVGASGTGLSYQWQFNGNNLSGATSQVLALSNLAATNAGSYRVVVSSSTSGSVTSQNANLLFFGDLKFMASTILAGPIGQQFRVDYADVLGGVTNWFTLANVTLPYSPYVVIDPDSRGRTNRYYRAVPLP